MKAEDYIAYNNWDQVTGLMLNSIASHSTSTGFLIPNGTYDWTFVAQIFYAPSLNIPPMKSGCVIEVLFGRSNILQRTITVTIQGGSGKLWIDSFSLMRKVLRSVSVY